MSDEEIKDEPAFPQLLPDPYSVRLEGGLMKREMFAAMAMQGLLTASSEGFVTDEIGWETCDWGRFAKTCTRAADALIAELEKASESHVPTAGA